MKSQQQKLQISNGSAGIYEIIILGAGPAGLSVAVESIAKGFISEKVLVLEKSDEIVHMISKKYPEEKPILANYKNKSVEIKGILSIKDMSKQEFMKFINQTVESSKIKIEFNSTVNKIVKLRNGQLQVCTTNECYIGNSVFIAIGSMASPRKIQALHIGSAYKRIFYDIQDVLLEMKDVLVVGGGDSAAEYAMILSDRGHNVSLSYRGKEFNKMTEVNSVKLEQMIQGKRIMFYERSEVSEIEAKDDILNVKLNSVPDITSFHAVVTALGTEKPTNYLDSIGIQMCHEGHEVFTVTSLPGVFTVGDLASKSGGTINIAFNSGAKAFNEACDLYLDCKM